MKKLAFYLLLALPFGLFAQGKTITVTVQDTILVVANHIKIQVEFKDTATTSYDAEPRTVFEDERREIIRILDQNKIAWKDETEALPFLGSRAAQYPGMPQKTKGIVVDFSTPEQANKVKPLLESIPFVRTTDMGASVDKNDLNKTRLYEKLFKRARAKAEVQAKIVGKRVGDVYAIGSEFEQMSPERYMDSLFGGGGMGGFFGQIMGMLSGMFNEKNTDYKVSVGESMSVTFTLLDK